MIPYLQDPDVTLYHGDVLSVLRELPDESVHCIATSPPFYALRDYGVDGQIGLEETPDAWAAALVAVFREARRVLRKDGTLWVECGDSYASSPKGNPGDQGTLRRQGTRQHETADAYDKSKIPGVKPKDLIGTPWLLAFALRADGWWLRGCNIWAKPNAMPESAKDRCTTAHSYVFQLSKSARYWFDGDAISEPYQGFDGRIATAITNNSHQTHDNYSNREGKDRWPNGPDGSRNPRSVWTIPTQGYPEAHFATWPEALARRIILAATSERGVCHRCLAPWVRQTERTPEKPNAARVRNVGGRTDGYTIPAEPGGLGNVTVQTLGWVPSCACVYDFIGKPVVPYVIPATVLDPFVGSGTTCHVARKLGRRSVGIDLNSEYLDLAARRLQQQSLFA